MAYVLATIGFLVLGLILGRWWTLVAPVLVWTLVAIGIDLHWWGRPGEQLTLGTIVLIGLGLCACAIGIGAHRVSRRRRRLPL